MAACEDRIVTPPFRGTPPTVMLPPLERCDDGDAHVIIGPYADMQAGHRVLVSWEGRIVSSAKIGPGDIGRPINVPVSQPHLSLQGFKEVRVSWCVLSASGPTAWATPVHIPITSASAREPAPWVDGTAGDLGNTFTVEADTPPPTVRVEGHGGVAGDRITVWCRGVTHTGSSVHWTAQSWELRRDGQTVDVDLPMDLLASTVGGELAVGYVIENDASAPRAAFIRRLRIQGSPTALPPPTVDQADGAVLDPQNASGGACIRVPSAAMCAADLRYELLWQGTTADGVVTHATARSTGETPSSDDQTFQITAREVARLDKGYVRIGYRVLTFVDIETRDGVTRDCVHVAESEWLELRVLITRPTPATATEDLNGFVPRRFERIKRAYLTLTPIHGTWCIRNGLDGIPPFQDGAFACGTSPVAALRVDFRQPCRSVRFGYGAGGPAGNGSTVRLNVYGEGEEPIAERVYQMPTTGLPGLWIDLQASDFGERIVSIVIHKDTTDSPDKVTAQVDNFTMGW